MSGLYVSSLSGTSAKTYVQRIKSSVRQMNRLMENVLMTGQIESDRLRFVPAAINLQQLCQNLVDECSVNLSDAHEMVFTYPEDALETWMDENLLRLIFSNLLNNAIKYSPTGGCIGFSYSYATAGQNIIFEVKDQGIGIPKSEQTNLFESFFRASNTKSIQGTGLGLAIVRQSVELHQGYMALTSEINVGTTVTITLPRIYQP